MEDVFPIENGHIPASYVSLPEGTRMTLWHYENFHPYLEKIPILTNIFQSSWNHQLGI